MTVRRVKTVRIGTVLRRYRRQFLEIFLCLRRQFFLRFLIRRFVLYEPEQGTFCRLIRFRRFLSAILRLFALFKFRTVFLLPDFFTRFRIFFFKHGFALFSPLFPGSSCGCPAYGVEDHVLPVLHENPEKTRKNETERRDHGADCADAAAEDSCGDVFRFRCGDQRSEGAAGERECGLAAVPDAETFRMENELLRKQRQQNHDAEYCYAERHDVASPFQRIGDEPAREADDHKACDGIDRKSENIKQCSGNIGAQRSDPVPERLCGSSVKHRQIRLVVGEDRKQEQQERDSADHISQFESRYFFFIFASHRGTSK